MKTLLRVFVLSGVLSALTAFGQGHAEIDAAIQDATRRYRGDIPTKGNRPISELVERQMTFPQSARTEEALKRYNKKAKAYRPYLEKIEKAKSEAERSRAIENLRAFMKENEKKQ